MLVQTMTLSPTAIALNRFGLGARADDSVSNHPERWLIDQFSRFEVRPAGFASLDDAGAAVKQYREQQQANRLMAKPPGAPDTAANLKATRKDFRQDVQALYRAGVQARADSALATEAPFVERMVHFWSNHFCVSADNPQVTAFAAAFERDAIRPHVLGKFADMTLVVEQHPAMLIYLNQFQSSGPNTETSRPTKCVIAVTPSSMPEVRRDLDPGIVREGAAILLAVEVQPPRYTIFVERTAFMGLAILQSGRKNSALVACDLKCERVTYQKCRPSFESPRRADKLIWRKECVPATFSDSNNCKDPRWH